jgi:myo-inositol-1(or 4)-monophosphatase
MNLFDTAIHAARAAGHELVARLPQERDVHSKGFRNLVTDADLAAQETLARIIHANFPGHGILSEEGLEPGGEAETVWVLDPLDGTSNYAHRFPNFAVSIGVAHGNETVIGVVYDPLREHLFCAERGGGATWNGERLRVSQTDELIHALVALDYAREPAVRAEQMATMANVSRHIHTFRSVGSAALSLCYVAAGWFDAYFHLTLGPWDCIAGGLMLVEAGGALTDWTGAPWHYTSPRVVATNGILQAAFLQAMTA